MAVVLYKYVFSDLCLNRGERLAYGHYYIRPHETFHEASRKFFQCEVVRVPLYEVLTLDYIVGICCVMDSHTFSLVRDFNVFWKRRMFLSCSCLFFYFKSLSI